MHALILFALLAQAPASTDAPPDVAPVDRQQPVAAPVFIQCRNGQCWASRGRVTSVHLMEREAKQAPVQKQEATQKHQAAYWQAPPRWRLFDGDGKPLRRAR